MNENRSDPEHRIQELEVQLSLAQKQLRDCHKELQASNEGLQVRNGELQTAMEELEAATEEFRTSNEQLQVTAEENRRQLEELAALTSDLQNLLTATESATLLLDRQLCILRFTPKLAELFSIRTTDRGRPISNMTSRMRYDDLQTDAEAVFRSLIPIEREVQDDAGRSYLTRVRPYRSLDNHVGGVVITFIEITARREAEEALRASEERFRALVSASSDALYRMSPDWREMRQLSGTGSPLDSDIPNRSWLEQYIPEQDRSEVLSAIQEAVRTKAIYELEHRVVRVDGSLGWAQSRAVPLLDADGQITEWFGAVTDVTARKRGEEAGRWLSAIVENSGDAIISKSLEGIITTWNPAAQRIFGYTETEAIGQPITLIIPPELWPEEVHILERLRAGERIEPFETVRVRKDGSTVDVSLTISPIRDPKGRITGASKIARDISERKRTEHELREREEDLRWTFDLSAQVPWTADPNGKVLDFSQRWTTLTGRTREELLGDGWMCTPHPEDLPRLRKAWAHALRTGEPYDVEHRLRTASGEYCWMRSRAYPRRDKAGRIVKWYGTTEDIHERKMAEEHMATMVAANRELELRSMELERADRLKNEFLSNMSHELRTPLHTIVGYTELLQEQVAGELNGKQQRFLGYIRNDADHLLDLVNGVLDLSKIAAGRLELNYESLDLARCIAESVRGMQARAAAKAIFLEDRTATAALRVRADPLRLKQVLYNLLGNAIKFTPEGGRVWIESAVEGTWVRITVADTGIGIALEEQARIFEKFHQAGNIPPGIREGTGLGLAITDKLIRLHGGHIWVESELDRGSRFIFSLPLERAERASAASEKA